MKKSLVYTTILLVISGYFPILFSQESEFHPFINDKNLCSTCHVTYQTANTSGNTISYIVVNVDSSHIHTYVCLGCHPHKAEVHPVQITSSFPVPKDLPVSKMREITCTTCHNPHFSRYSSRPWIPRSFLQILNDFVKRKKQYKTYFLRRNNSKGELCMSCHKPVRHDSIWKF